MGIKSRYSAVWALRETGLLKLLALNRQWREDSPELVEFHRRFKASKRLQKALGMNVGKSTPMHWFQRVLFRVGLNTKKKQVREGEKRFHIYWIDPETWNDAYRKAILQTFPNRWKQYFFEDYSEPNFEAETPAVTAVKVVNTSPNNSIELGEVLTNSFDDSQGRIIPEKHIQELQEVMSWLDVSVKNRCEGLKDILSTVRLYLEELPQLKRLLWQSLTEGVKQMIAELSPLDYRFLAS